MRIGFPTVPEGKARLRTIVTATHKRADLERAAEIIARVGKNSASSSRPTVGARFAPGDLGRRRQQPPVAAGPLVNASTIAPRPQNTTSSTNPSAT